MASKVFENISVRGVLTYVGDLLGLTHLTVDNLDLNGNTISSTDTNGNINLSPNGSGIVDLGGTADVGANIRHTGDLDTQIAFATDDVDIFTAGISRLSCTTSGVRLGGANARVTTILDEDDMSSDSATSLATQQSIKAYADLRPTTAGITASVTQTQGQQALTSEINEVSTVGTINDVVTLPAAAAGKHVYVINNGANTLQIFPASGDNLGAGVNTSTTLAAAANVHYVAYDATNWESV